MKAVIVVIKLPTWNARAPGINDRPNVAETSLKDKKSVIPGLNTELVGNEKGLIMLETNY